MGVFDQADYDIRFEWGPRGLEALGSISNTVVIVDILSFTTWVTIAVERGASVVPFGDSETAYRPSSKSFLEAAPGERIRLSAPNGSHLALLAQESGSVVLAGSLLNAAAVASAAGNGGPATAVVAAGERWPNSAELRPAIEDLVGAGAIIGRLPGRRSPEADVALHVFESARTQLNEVIAGGVSGKELARLGYSEDIEIASRLDVATAVAVLREGAFQRLT